MSIKKYKGKELDFISLINRDGSGTIQVGTEWNDKKGHPKTDSVSYLDEDVFTLSTLSLSERTFIAVGFNSWVVRVK